MKKIIFTLISTILITSLSFSQATLEHSYISKNWNYENTNAFKTETGLNFYTLDSSTGTLLIYNNSHNLIKTINIVIPNGYTLNSLFFITDKLFNTDSLIEFIISFRSSNGLDDILTLINENETILQQFGNKHVAYIFKVTNEEFKLITLSNPFTAPTSNNFDYDVYSLPGSTLNVSKIKFTKNLFFGFPNPTESKINITNNLEHGENATLEVFDVNGKKVMKKNVTGDDNKITLNVNELSNGMYIYKLKGETNRFIKK